MNITVGNLFEGVEFHEVLKSLDACKEALEFQGDKCIIDTIEAMQKAEAESENSLVDLGVFWDWAVWLALRLSTRFAARNDKPDTLMYLVCEDILTLERQRIRIMEHLVHAGSGLLGIPSQRIRESVNLHDVADNINQTVYSEGLAQVLSALKWVVLPAHREATGEE